MDKDFYKHRKNAERWANEGMNILGLRSLYLIVQFSGRFTRRLGDATLLEVDKGRIRLSKPMWPMIEDAKRRSTVLHEVAHIAVRNEEERQGLPRSKPHGRKWRETMIRLGEKPERCHDVALHTVPGTQLKYRVKCSCRDFYFSKRRFNNLLRGTKYRCKTCKKFVEVAEQ